MVELIQISDLHYGSREFREECLLNVIDYINENRPDAVICTGDLTHKAKKYQYEDIARYLAEIKVPIFNVIGNHDVKNNGIVFLERYLGPRRGKVALDDKDTILIGVRSPRDNTSEGELGDEQLEWMVQQLKNNDNRLRVLALHHHLIAVPYAGTKRDTVIDAGEALELTQAYNIDLVLMGHRHVPHAWRLGNTVLLYCGTTTSDKVRADEAPCFNEISLYEDELEVQVVDSHTLSKNLLISQKRGKIDYVRPRKTRIDHIVQTKVFQDSF
ncbi:MAG: metallophosphoesterase [Promethearchaeota archaeon]|nr:MAG: metallophosphoesterase [Candidatus Lokiarchaeota archaeon]